MECFTSPLRKPYDLVPYACKHREGGASASHRGIADLQDRTLTVSGARSLRRYHDALRTYLSLICGVFYGLSSRP